MYLRHFRTRSDLSLFHLKNVGNIENLNNANDMRNCYLGGLLDLYTGTDYVRNTIAAYLNKLIAIGVAGARIDAPKNIWPVVSSHESRKMLLKNRFFFAAKNRT